MVDAGILDEDDRVELLDGVLVEMSPQGSPHAYAIVELTALAAPAVSAAGLRLSIQGPVDVGSPISLPEPDLAIVPVAAPDALPRNPLLVVEMGVTSLRIDLVRKARIYATGNVPEYWVLDVERRALIVHRAPQDGAYTDVRTLDEHETVTAIGDRSHRAGRRSALNAPAAQPQRGLAGGPRARSTTLGRRFLSTHSGRSLTPHGQDHRHRPRYHQLLHGCAGRWRAHGHRELGGRSHDALRRGLRAVRRASRRHGSQAPVRHQPETRSSRSSASWAARRPRCARRNRSSPTR